MKRRTVILRDRNYCVTYGISSRLLSQLQAGKLFLITECKWGVLFVKKQHPETMRY